MNDNKHEQRTVTKIAAEWVRKHGEEVEPGVWQVRGPLHASLRWNQNIKTVKDRRWGHCMGDMPMDYLVRNLPPEREEPAMGEAGRFSVGDTTSVVFPWGVKDAEDSCIEDVAIFRTEADAKSFAGLLRARVATPADRPYYVTAERPPTKEDGPLVLATNFGASGWFPVSPNSANKLGLDLWRPCDNLPVPKAPPERECDALLERIESLEAEKHRVHQQAESEIGGLWDRIMQLESELGAK